MAPSIFGADLSWMRGNFPGKLSPLNALGNRNIRFLVAFFLVVALLGAPFYFSFGNVSLQRGVRPSLNLGSDQELSGWKTIHVYVGNSTYGENKQRRPGWYSQSGQDETVCRIFEISSGHCRGRFFLDLAANDAAGLSNTKALEDRFGWNGICIEANYEYLYGLAHRKCQVFAAIVSAKSKDVVEFIEHPNNKRGWAGGIVSDTTDNKPSVNGTKVKKHATSLLEILRLGEAPRLIDYFSFDVEGAEDLILVRSVLEEYTFLVVTIERPKAGLVQLLESFDYLYLKNHGGFGDKMYIHSSLSKVQEVKALLT